MDDHPEEKEHIEQAEVGDSIEAGKRIWIQSKDVVHLEPIGTAEAR